MNLAWFKHLFAVGVLLTLGILTQEPKFLKGEFFAIALVWGTSAAFLLAIVDKLQKVIDRIPAGPMAAVGMILVSVAISLFVFGVTQDFSLSESNTIWVGFLSVSAVGFGVMAGFLALYFVLESKTLKEAGFKTRNEALEKEQEDQS